MKSILTLVLGVMVSSCGAHQLKTGQRFSIDSPNFYLSISPSFDTPSEYEVISDTLIFREFSGVGGYEWGKSKEIARWKLTREQEIKIRELAITAVKHAIENEQATQEEIVVMDGTNWYILTDYGVGPFLSISTNQPPISFYELREYVDGILQPK